MTVTSRFRIGIGMAADWRAAVGDCLQQIGNVGGNVGFVYITDRLADDLDAILAELKRGTGIDTWTGTVGLGVCATGTELFDRPALVAMVGELPEGSYALFDSKRDQPEVFAAAHADWHNGASMPFGVIHADPRNPDAIDAIGTLAQATGSYLVGGLASSRGPHPLIAGGIGEGGLSGLMLSGDVAVSTALTQGCSPVGEPHTVTAAERNIVIELDGRPALEVMKEDIGELLARDLSKLAGYIFAALPVAGTDWNDYLVRNLAGIDPNQGLVAIGDTVTVGQSLMFCRRDRATAAEDLSRMLAKLKRGLDGEPRGALYHTCLARGPNMFPGESAELGAIKDALGDVPLVGFFGNGEIANARLYSYTGVLTLFL
ncbi:MAG: FIST N-terminal domain-containing protein [Alphaproteobacteria bacterium]